MPTSWWIAFNALVLFLLALDLGVFNRKAHAVSVREALGWSAVWISLAIGFGLWIGQAMGRQAMFEFYAGYLVEQALSVDNLFVFILIFGYFRVPPELQHRVLFWGILGALLMRGAMIGAGALLLAQFHWIIYLFGAFLLYTGFKMAFGGDSEIEPEQNPVIRVVRRFLPLTTTLHGERFFVRESLSPGGAVRLVATPLFVVLALVETTDVVFALDSIPAILFRARRGHWQVSPAQIRLGCRPSVRGPQDADQRGASHRYWPVTRDRCRRTGGQRAALAGDPTEGESAYRRLTACRTVGDGNRC